MHPGIGNSFLIGDDLSTKVIIHGPTELVVEIGQNIMNIKAFLYF